MHVGKPMEIVHVDVIGPGLIQYFGGVGIRTEEIKWRVGMQGRLHFFLNTRKSVWPG